MTVLLSLQKIEIYKAKLNLGVRSDPYSIQVDYPYSQARVTSQCGQRVPFYSQTSLPQTLSRSRAWNNAQSDMQPGLESNSPRDQNQIRQHPAERLLLQNNSYAHPNYTIYPTQNRMPRSTSSFEFKTPPFTDNEDWAVWVNRFEVIAERQQWDDDEMIDHLLP